MFDIRLRKALYGNILKIRYFKDPEIAKKWIVTGK
jgi:hypothetical protein